MRQEKGMVIATVLMLALVLAMSIVGSAMEDGRFNSYTTNGCTCHSSGISPTVSVDLTGLPVAYVPGLTYIINITVTGGPAPYVNGNNAAGGFNIYADDGTFLVPGGSTAVKVNGPQTQATHTLSGNDQRSWEVEWVAPGVGSGLVSFQCVGMAVDGDGVGNPDADDLWAYFTTQIPEGAPVPQPPTADVLYPDGGESLTGGSTHNIQFNLFDADHTNDQLVYWINYSIDGGASFAPIPAAQGLMGTANPNSFAWNLPLVDTTVARVNIDVADPDWNNGTDMSAADFEIDSTHPDIIGTTPVGIDIIITTDVRADFNEPMNQTSAEGAFSLKDTATWTLVPGTFSWMANTIVFDPTGNLVPGTEYMANMTTTALDDSDPGNNMLVLVSWTFTTMSGGDVFPPQISDVTADPSPQEIGGDVNVSAIVTDNVAVDTVWINVTYPGGGAWFESVMDYDSVAGRYYVETTYPLVGTYDFIIWANDTNGLTNSSAGQFIMEDTTVPTIDHVPVTLALAADNITISATVTDNYALATTDPVWLDYTNVSGTNLNVSMTDMGGGVYEYEIPAQLVEGTVMYFVWAADTSGNEVMTAVYMIDVVAVDTYPPEILNVQADPSPQERYGSVNITATVRDLSGVSEVRAIVSLSGAEVANLSMNLYATDVYYAESTYDLVGTHDFTIWAVDVNSVENTSAGHFFEIEDTTPPAIPTGLTVATGDEDGTLDVSWNANTDPDLDGYNLYRSDALNGTYVMVNTAVISGTTYTDSGLEDNTTYYYKLKAVDDEGQESDFSQPASGTTRTPSGEEADITWIYLIIALILILIILFAVGAASRRKPPEEEEELEDFEAIDEEAVEVETVEEEPVEEEAAEGEPEEPDALEPL